MVKAHLAMIEFASSNLPKARTALQDYLLGRTGELHLISGQAAECRLVFPSGGPSFRIFPTEVTRECPKLGLGIRHHDPATIAWSVPRMLIEHQIRVDAEYRDYRDNDEDNGHSEELVHLSFPGLMPFANISVLPSTDQDEIGDIYVRSVTLPLIRPVLEIISANLRYMGWQADPAVKNRLIMKGERRSFVITFDEANAVELPTVRLPECIITFQLIDADAQEFTETLHDQLVQRLGRDKTIPPEDGVLSGFGPIGFRFFNA